MRIVRYTAIVGQMYAARLRALARLPGTEVHAVQITGVRAFHDWKFDLDTTGFTVHTLFDKPLLGLGDAEISRAAIAVIERLAPDACAIGGYGNAYLRDVAQWCKRHGVLSILVSDSHFFSGPRRWWPREKVKGWVIARLFDGVYASGERARLYHRQLGFEGVPIVIGHDAADNDFFKRESAQVAARADELRAEYGLPAAYFLYVGRLSPEKNLARLLEAYRLYRQRAGRPWDLVLVGAGPQEAALKDLHRKLGVEGVHWAGWRSYGELAVYYTLARAFVLPSTGEPWGIVVNEAMVCGLPVVISERCGSAPELVRECENGFWFDPYRVDDMADALGRMSESPDWESMSRRSRALVESYTPELGARRLMLCIERAMQWRDAGRSPARGD